MADAVAAVTDSIAQIIITDNATRPSPCVIHRKLVKSYSEDGAKVINGYKMLRQIGEGGYATVHEAEQLSTGQHFALKKMSKRQLQKAREYSRPDCFGRPKVVTALDKVRREIALMESLWCEHLVKMLQVIDDDSEDSLILVLELLPRGQIMSFDGERKLYRSTVFLAHTDSLGIEEKSLKTVIASMLDSLHYLHQRRIVHRDVKPDNLLVSDTMTVKLADLGVARKFDDNEPAMISETHGTYHFFAPEMCSGEKYDPFKADIWALGVTCFILATSHLPFLADEGNTAQLFELIAEGAVMFPAEPVLSAELKDLLVRILDKNPDRRLSLSQIQQHPFLRSAASESVSSARSLPRPIVEIQAAVSAQPKFEEEKQ